MAGFPAATKTPSFLHRLFPVLAKPPDPTFPGTRFAYGINTVLAVTSSFVLAEIIFSQPWQRMLIQIIRALIFLLLSIASGHTISKGWSAVPVKTWFYVVKTLVIIVFNAAIAMSQWRRNPESMADWSVWDWIDVLLPLGLGLFSAGLLAWRLFRRRESYVTLSMALTFGLCAYSFVVAMGSAIKAYRQDKDTTGTIETE